MVEFNRTAERRVTQRDIARIVGVSHAAVSQVLHQVPRSRVHPETRAEIVRVAKMLGYEPRGTTTRTVSLVISPLDFHRAVTAVLLEAAEEALRTRGYRMSISVLGESDYAQAAQRFNQKNVDGLLFTAWPGEHANHFQAIPVPWVLIADADDIPDGVDQIGGDTVQTARMLAGYLLEKGHKELCLVTGRAGIGYHERVKRGASEALQAAGLSPENLHVVHTDVTRESGQKALVDFAPPPSATAIITTSADGAQMVLNRLQRAGRRVPEEISLVSMMDAPGLSALEPAITATTVIGRQLIENAVERLLNRIQHPALPLKHVFISGQIVERESVRAPGIQTTQQGSN